VDLLERFVLDPDGEVVLRHTRWSRCWPVEHSVTPHNVYDAGSSCTARRSTPSIRSPTPRSAGDIDVLGRRLVP
jgi:hypothetical protein